MPGKATIKIFIASSNELKNEREKCVLLINQLNKSHKHLHLEPVEWEIDMVHSNYPGHENIQDAINPKLKESDLAIFIFYSKLGKYTFEEFEFANKENKKLFAFFKTGFSPDVEELVSYGELLKFKKSLNDTILYKEYDDLDSFEKFFYPNLNLYLAESHPVAADESDLVSIAVLSQSVQQLIQTLTAKDEEIKNLRENTNQLPAATLKIQINELLEEKERIKNELLQSEEIKKQLAKDKEALEKQLAPQIEHDKLKAKALKELEKGNFVEAENYLIESAKASVEETASTFFELAKIKRIQLQYPEALHYYELATKIDPDNSLYLNAAGVMADEMGHYNNAILFFEKALAIDKKLFGDNHQKVTTNYNNIGVAYSSKGEYNIAIEYFEKALAIDKMHLGEDHPDIATRYNNIGSAYINKGEFDKAIEYCKKALDIDKKFYGEEHPTIAIRYNNIGLAYIYKAEFDKAIEYCLKALKIYKKTYREDHLDIALCNNNLGGIYRKKGEYNKSIGFYKRALATLKKIHGEDHPYIAICYNNIGTAYNYKGEFDKAIECFEKALAIDKKFHEEQHPSIATRYNNLGGAYILKKEYKKGIEYLQSALTILLNFLPESHLNIKTIKENMEEAKKNQKTNVKD